MSAARPIELPETLLKSLEPELHAGLVQLLEAYDLARALQRPFRDFSVEMRELHRVGLTNTHLRALLCLGYLTQALERTSAGQKHRRLEPANNPLTFADNSCFTLTEAGVAFARATLSRAGPSGQPSANGYTKGNGSVLVPHWDRDLRKLWMQNLLVKQYCQPAPLQETILAVFEEERWPPRIDDPLPPDSNQMTKLRLHDAIIRLNRHHKHHLIQFHGDGRGEGICWEPIPPGRKRSI